MDYETLSSTDERILAARNSLATRMAALEDRVTGTVTNAAAAVEDTTQSLRATVHDVTDGARGLFDDSADSLKEALDFRQHIRAHPWQGTLTAFATGYLASLFLHRPASSPIEPMTDSQPHPMRNLLGILRRELMSLGEKAISTASSSLQENIQTLVEDTTQPRSRHERLEHSLSNGHARAN